jgi:hypothetical protein
MLDLGSYHAIVACVAGGTGVAIVPAEVLDHAVLGTAVQRHPLPARVRVNHTHLVWSGGASPALLALIDLLPTQSRSSGMSKSAVPPSSVGGEGAGSLRSLPVKERQGRAGESGTLLAPAQRES